MLDEGSGGWERKVRERVDKQRCRICTVGSASFSFTLVWSAAKTLRYLFFLVLQDRLCELKWVKNQSWGVKGCVCVCVCVWVRERERERRKRRTKKEKGQTTIVCTGTQHNHPPTRIERGHWLPSRQPVPCSHSETLPSSTWTAGVRRPPRLFRLRV